MSPISSRTSSLTAISLQYYDDDTSQYSETAVKEAISTEVTSLHNKDLFDAVSSSDLTPEELKKVIKTKWVIADIIEDIASEVHPATMGRHQPGYLSSISKCTHPGDHLCPTATSTFFFGG